MEVEEVKEKEEDSAVESKKCISICNSNSPPSSANSTVVPLTHSNSGEDFTQIGSSLTLPLSFAGGSR